MWSVSTNRRETSWQIVQDYKQLLLLYNKEIKLAEGQIDFYEAKLRRNKSLIELYGTRKSGALVKRSAVYRLKIDLFRTYKENLKGGRAKHKRAFLNQLMCITDEKTAKILVSVLFRPDKQLIIFTDEEKTKAFNFFAGL